MPSRQQIVLVLALMAAQLGGVVPAGAQSEVATAPLPVPTITVTGEATVHAAPDMAIFTLGVEREDKRAADALAALGDDLARVLAELEAAGVDARDLQTSGLRLEPLRDGYASGQDAPPRILAYRASSEVRVRVRTLGRLGPLLDAAVRDGANRLEGLSLTVADPGPMTDAARRAAVTDAMDKARLFAQAAGVALPPLLRIDETGSGRGIPMAAEFARGAAAGLPVATGEIGISAQVTLTFGAP